MELLSYESEQIVAATTDVSVSKALKFVSFQSSQGISTILFDRSQKHVDVAHSYIDSQADVSMDKLLISGMILRNSRRISFVLGSSTILDIYGFCKTVEDLKAEQIAQSIAAGIRDILDLAALPVSVSKQNY
jgi:hypothetical protein